MDATVDTKEPKSIEKEVLHGHFGRQDTGTNSNIYIYIYIYICVCVCVRVCVCARLLIVQSFRALKGLPAVVQLRHYIGYTLWIVANNVALKIPWHGRHWYKKFDPKMTENST